MKMRTHKYRTRMIFCCAAVLLATALTGCAEPREVKTAPDSDTPAIIIGSDNYPPYNYEDADGKPAGIDVDLATEAPDSLQRETADGLALEGLLGTEAPEEGLVERIALREAVDQLPEKERMTILLRYFKGLTQERAARVLGVSQVQVSRLERRGLDRLRQSFAE